MGENRRAIVLLSGGLDSATVLGIALSSGYSVYALTFRYGQRHAVEIEAALRIAEKAEVIDHLIVDINSRIFGSSALTSEIAVPKDRGPEQRGGGVPVTYVPARNTIFLSFALAWAEVLRSNDIFIGVNALDYSGYPDCRIEYVAAYERMANLATKAGVEGLHKLKIHSPLIHLTKGEIIKRGLELSVDYSLTVSCYDPSANGDACGRCDSCIVRLKGFSENGLADPAAYVAPGLTRT